MGGGKNAKNEAKNASQLCIAKYAGLPRNQIKLRNKRSLSELNNQLLKTKLCILKCKQTI